LWLFIAQYIFKVVFMVKSKLILTTAFLVASFMLGSLSVSAAEYTAQSEPNQNVYEKIIVEHAEDSRNYEANKNDYYQDNINNYGTKTDVQDSGNYVEIEPITFEPTALERPNIVNRINEVNNVRVNGYIPQLSGMNARAAERINARIQESFTNLVNTGHREITADFDVHNWGGMTSLVVRYNMAGDRQVVHTFVFDNVSKTEVTLRNLLGRDFMSYINSRIGTELRADNSGNVHSNITGFRTIRASQNFYVKDGNIHILFEQSRVAHARYGVVEFVLPIRTLNYTLPHSQFVVEDNTIFVPATVARRFGMDVHVAQGGVMHIRSGERTVNVNVHNERKNPNEVTYMNGYDVALSAEFLRSELGIEVERVPNSREIIVTYRFDR